MNKLKYPRFQIVPVYTGTGFTRSISGNQIIIYTSPRCGGFKSQRTYKSVDGAYKAGERALKNLEKANG